MPPQFTTDNLFLPQAIVVVWGAGSNANIVNLNIAGPLPGNGGCADDEYGVLVIASGTATLKGDHVTDIRDSNPGLFGCQFGVAIQVGREYWPTADFSHDLVENFVGHATITKTTVTGYQKNGITVDGPGSKSNITKSTVKGMDEITKLPRMAYRFHEVPLLWLRATSSRTTPTPVQVLMHPLVVSSFSVARRPPEHRRGGGR